MSTEADRMKEAMAIIARSGNTFHSKVNNLLKERGWTTEVSPYYTDIQTGKPREIDLIAEKLFPAKNGWNEVFGYVAVRLFIECKFMPNVLVFWLNDRNLTKAEELVLRTTPCGEGSRETKRHHYLSDQPVAKLVDDGRNKAADNELVFKAVNQCLNGTIHYRHKPSILNELRVKSIYNLHYPVIMCNSFDNLFCTRMKDEGKPWPITNNFHMEIDYAYFVTGGSANEYFLIDMVDFGRIDQFFQSIQVDVDLAAFFIR